jgi:hypothetical protein
MDKKLNEEKVKLEGVPKTISSSRCSASPICILQQQTEL